MLLHRLSPTCLKNSKLNYLYKLTILPVTLNALCVVARHGISRTAPCDGVREEQVFFTGHIQHPASSISIEQRSKQRKRETGIKESLGSVEERRSVEE